MVQEPPDPPRQLNFQKTELGDKILNESLTVTNSYKGGIGKYQWIILLTEPRSFRSHAPAAADAVCTYTCKSN